MQIPFLFLDNMCVISALENNIVTMLMSFTLDIGSRRYKSRRMAGSFMVKQKQI